MRVLLKLVLDCDPDAAWRAIRSPSVLNAVSGPLSRFVSLEDGGFTETWTEGEHPVRMLGGGVFAVGEQIIDISYSSGRDRRGRPVRMVRDTGRGLSGPLALITRWDHRMVISPAPGGRTLYRDQLSFEAGPITALLWPFYWAFWQWRATGIRRLAPTWTA